MLLPEKRIFDFEQLGFGLFIHFGLYSIIGKGEWIKCIGKIDNKVYNSLTDKFTVKKLNFNKIAKIARSAGVKYIVLTTRHHDGFSLYDTHGLNDFDAPHSACKRDLIKEFVAACRNEGLKPFFYHTTLDWYNENYKENFEEYQKYLRKSIEILCTNYGEVGGFWFDGNWDKPNADWEEAKLYSLIRNYQPNAIIVNNTGLAGRGKIGNIEIDSVTFEQGRPTPMDRTNHIKYIAAEMCETMNEHWGFGENDLNYKSPKHLIESLCSCRKVGANYLLNIGPSKNGDISLMQTASLDVIGKWMNKFGVAIYNGQPSLIIGKNNDFVLTDRNKPKVDYFFIYELNIGGHENVTTGSIKENSRFFSNVDEEYKEIKWLDNNEKLGYEMDRENKCLKIDCTNFPYGSHYIVRVAIAIRK